MLRIALIAAVALTVCASAVADEDQDAQVAEAEPPAQSIRHDGFVTQSDECGASRYAHLLGEQYAELHHAALPANSNVVDRGRLSTLEYTPGRLNVVVNGAGRIIAIGCF